MAEAAIIEVVQKYLQELRKKGLHARKAILYGSHARGDAQAESDIDLIIIATEFEPPGDPVRQELLWTMRVCTDSRIEPLGIGEQRWLMDEASPVIEDARREGLEIQ
jgi:hypothetical protein